MKTSEFAERIEGILEASGLILLSGERSTGLQVQCRRCSRMWWIKSPALTDVPALTCAGGCNTIDVLENGGPRIADLLRAEQRSEEN